MIDIIDKAKCCGCYACFNSCPKQCIIMKKDEEGFLYPFVNQDECINCGLCEKACPMLDCKGKSNPIATYAAQCKEDSVLLESSSGGLFSVLATAVLEKGGVVFGAGFSSDYKEVTHIEVDRCEELNRLRTSKYVQSKIGKTFKRVKKLLDCETIVLFSGVPCQIAGLKRFLKKEYDNLFCVDVICHGVPSPELWKKYLLDTEKMHQGIVVSVNFRHKKSPIHDYGINETADSVEVFSAKGTDPYMQMFLKNFSLRPSCYSCHAKENGSDADITLGDFWGIQNVLPEMEDGRGVSAVVIHTKKGQQLFEEVLCDIKAEKVLYENVRTYNSPIYKSVVKPDGRDTFFKDMDKLTFAELSEKYCVSAPKSMKQKLARTVLWQKIRPIFRQKPKDNNHFEYGIFIRIKKDKGVHGVNSL